jgi:hypothetical protein
MNSAGNTDARFAKTSQKRCAYCGEPLLFNTVGFIAWKAGKQLACNELCAEGITDNSSLPKERRS